MVINDLIVSVLCLSQATGILSIYGTYYSSKWVIYGESKSRNKTLHEFMTFNMQKQRQHKQIIFWGNSEGREISINFYPR